MLPKLWKVCGAAAKWALWEMCKKLAREEVSDMKVGKLEFAIPSIGEVEMEDIECTAAEFKELLETVKELQKMEVEKAKISAEALRRQFKWP